MTPQKADALPKPIRPERRHSFLADVFRPILTAALMAAVYTGSWYLVMNKSLTPDVWFQFWSQLLLMLVAYYFGERNATRHVDTRKDAQ